MTPANIQPDVQGDLQRYPLPRLLFLLLKKTFTGWLEISAAESYNGSVFYRQGLPAFTDIPSSTDVLGRVLLEWGMISEEAFNQSLQQLARGDLLQGQILLRAGAIDQEGLVTGLTLQLQRKLSRLFTLVQASFAIFSGEHPHGKDAETSRVRVDPLRVIYQGVRNAFTLDRMQPELDKLQGLDITMRAAYEPLLPRYGFGEEEQTLMPSLIQDAHSIPQLLKISNLSPLDTQMLIYTLWVTEALVTSPSAKAPHPVPPPQGSEPPKITPPPEESRTPIITLPPPEGPRPSLITPPPPEEDIHPVLTTPLEDSPFVTSAPTADENDFADFPKLNTGTGIPVSPIRRPTTKTALPVIDPAAAQEQAALITKTYKRLQGQSHYEVLGLERTASVEQVRAAYFKLAKVYHPDKCTALGLDKLTTEAEEIFRLINEAHSVLGDPTARAAYEGELDSNGDARSALQAEIAFQRGVILIRKKDFAAAHEAFKEACRLNDAEGEHHGWSAWALFKNAKLDREKTLPQVQKQLERAVELAPKSAQCHYFLGEVFLFMGNNRRAKACFEKTVQIQDWHIEANRHLRIMQMRREKTGKSGGGSSAASERNSS